MCFTSTRNGNLLVIALRWFSNPKDIFDLYKMQHKIPSIVSVLDGYSVYVLEKNRKRMQNKHWERGIGKQREWVNEMEKYSLQMFWAKQKNDDYLCIYFTTSSPLPPCLSFSPIFLSVSHTVSKFHFLYIYVCIFEHKIYYFGWMCLYTLWFLWNFEEMERVKWDTEARADLHSVQTYTWCFEHLGKREWAEGIERSINFSFDMNPFDQFEYQFQVHYSRKNMRKKRFNSIWRCSHSFVYIVKSSGQNAKPCYNIFYKCSRTRVVYTYYALVTNCCESSRFDLTNGIEVLLSVWFTGTKLNKLLVPAPINTYLQVPFAFEKQVNKGTCNN